MSRRDGRYHPLSRGAAYVGLLSSDGVVRLSDGADYSSIAAAFRARTGDTPDFGAALPAELQRHIFPDRAAGQSRRPPAGKGWRERRLRG